MRRSENILRQRTTPIILEAKRVCNQGGSNVYSLRLEVKDPNAKRTDGISPGLGNRYGQRAIRRPFRRHFSSQQLRSVCAIAAAVRATNSTGGKRRFQSWHERMRRCSLRTLRLASA